MDTRTLVEPVLGQQWIPMLVPFLAAGAFLVAAKNKWAYVTALAVSLLGVWYHVARLVGGVSGEWHDYSGGESYYIFSVLPPEQKPAVAAIAIAYVALGISAIVFWRLGATRVCPSCKRRIHQDATICPHCRTHPGVRTGAQSSSVDKMAKAE